MEKIKNLSEIFTSKIYLKYNLKNLVKTEFSCCFFATYQKYLFFAYIFTVILIFLI